MVLVPAPGDRNEQAFAEAVAALDAIKAANTDIGLAGLFFDAGVFFSDLSAAGQGRGILVLRKDGEKPAHHLRQSLQQVPSARVPNTVQITQLPPAPIHTASEPPAVASGTGQVQTITLESLAEKMIHLEG